VASRPKQPAAAPWTRRRSLAVGLGALVVAAAGWWVWQREPRPATRVGVAEPRLAVPGGRGAPGASRVAPLPPPAVAPYPAAGAAGVTTDDPLTAYRKANVYPPTSRPLTKDQLDLLRPNERHEAMRPTDHGLGLAYLFTADRYFVVGDETLTARLEVRRKTAPVSVKITQAFATVVGSAADPPIPVGFVASGDNYTATFAPGKLGLRRQTAITMSIEFDHGAGVQRGHFDFQYTPPGGIPARFTGVFRDAVDAGSLVIHAGVAVAVAGHYVIDCNLFDATDQPVAWSRYKGELATGEHDAELVFFGKVLVDGDARGPFHVGQLRGARYAPGQDPDLEQMPSFTGSYVTRPYPADAFSDAEYDSADKRRMIELLGSDTSHRGGAGRGDTGTP
jgi:hypothetical protein